MSRDTTPHLICHIFIHCANWFVIHEESWHDSSLMQLNLLTESTILRSRDTTPTVAIILWMHWLNDFSKLLNFSNIVLLVSKTFSLNQSKLTSPVYFVVSNPEWTESLNALFQSLVSPNLCHQTRVVTRLLFIMPLSEMDARPSMIWLFFVFIVVVIHHFEESWHDSSKTDLI